MISADCVLMSRRRALLAGAVFVFCFFAAQVSQAATIVVDGTNCTLPQAITAANQPTSCGTSIYAGSTGADTITFDANYTSTITPGAQLTVTSDITIVGAAREISGNNGHRVFHVQSGHLRLDRLEINRGVIGSAGSGGAILVNSGAALTVTNSRFALNRSDDAGGAIASSGALTISNSSLTSNTASPTGGGAIYISGGSATITHVTMYNNTAGGANPTGGELLISGSAARVYLRNSILGDDDSSSNDCGLTNNATLAQNVGNVIEAGDAGCTTASNRRTIGISGTRGSPEAITINANSHANGAGDNAICKANPTDQTGIRRPATACDAGAAERDGFNDIYVDSTCTLRQAIITAGDQSTQNQCELGVDDDTAIDAIWLSADHNIGSAPQVIVESSFVIEGQGHTITRDAADRIFLVRNNANMTLRNVTISGGQPAGDGGAFNVQGGAGIHLEDCVIKDNTSSGATGGGIYFHSNHGTSTIDRCAFINNRASASSGGAFRVLGGTVTITNSTFTNNHSAADGGAIYIDGGSATFSHVTLWDNTSGSTGYITGIRGRSTTNVNNSIIGRSATAGGALCGGSFNNSSSERGIIMWNGPIQSNPCGTVTVADPKLGAQNGSVPHFPLQVGSAAIGVGVDAQCALYPIDQAGNARPSSNCDAGAVQYLAPPRVGDGSGGDLGIPKTGGRWVQHADGSWHYVRPGEEGDSRRPVCTGELLNEMGVFKVSTTYGLCNGVQFNQLELSAIGIGYVVGAAPIAAVDVWGWVTAYVEVCWRGYASALFLDAATAPRTVSQLATTFDGVWTCAQISSAGTIVFMPAQSYLTTAPGDAAAPDAPANATPFGSCMATLNYILNFRATPGGDVRMILPYGVKLTAFQRSGDWVEVDYHGLRGWVSASHVTLEGAC